MSVPVYNQQRSFLDTDQFIRRLFEQAPAGRFEFFAERIMPALVALRPQLAAMYCDNNGRPCEEPVRMLAISILQFMEGLPDRRAVEACCYDLRWKYALEMEVDAPSIHSTSLVKFRQRLLKNGLNSIAFDAVLEAMRKAGYLKARKAQRLDSSHVLGMVSEMSRLECIREAVRLTLERVSCEDQLAHPEAWSVWWDRYVESLPDYKAGQAVLQEKMLQAGADACDLLTWLDTLPDTIRALKETQTLRRVFEENFEEREAHLAKRRAQPPGAVQNPHDPDAQWSSKGTIPAKQKDWVGYKVQVAETVPTPDKSRNAPTDAVLTAVVTQPAIASDKAAMPEVEQEWERTQQEKPEALYVDGGYTSGKELARAEQEEREIKGPVQPAPARAEKLSAEAFDISIGTRRAVCPGGHASTNCSRMEEATGKVNYRFEWTDAICQSCPLREQCVGANQRHRALVVGEHHEHVQARRREMKTPEFQAQMHQRNGVEGTISELKRGYGMRRCRYRGLAKTTLQNYMIAAACNIKRWARRADWELNIGGMHTVAA